MLRHLNLIVLVAEHLLEIDLFIFGAVHRPKISTRILDAIRSNKIGWRCVTLIMILIGAYLLPITPSFAQGLTAHEKSSEELYAEGLRAISEQRLDDAKAAFRQLITLVPQHAGAWLELALIQCELGNKDEAEYLFNTIIERFHPAPAILEVINQHRAKGCRGRPLQSRLSLLVERGVDTNVNQGASNSTFGIGSGDSRVDLQLLPEFLPREDQFSTFSADYLRELNRDGVLGIAQFRTRQYDHLSRFSTASLALGVDTPWHIGRWQGNASLTLSALTLDQHLYQKQAILQTRLKLPWQLPEHFRWDLVAGLTRTEYPTLLNYDANTYELRNVLEYQRGAHRVQASVGILTDRANRSRVGGDRHGELANVLGRSRIDDAIYVEWGASFQHWQSQLAYSPGLIDQARNQRTLTYRSALSFSLSDSHSLQLEVRHVRNHENISLFDYQSNVVQASWSWQGF